MSRFHIGVRQLAATFKKKAAALSESGKAEATLYHGAEGHAFLMKFIQDKLEEDDWSDEDAAELSAAFFFLLTCDEADADDGDEDEEDLI